MNLKNNCRQTPKIIVAWHSMEKSPSRKISGSAPMMTVGGVSVASAWPVISPGSFRPVPIKWTTINIAVNQIYNFFILGAFPDGFVNIHSFQRPHFKTFFQKKAAPPFAKATRLFFPFRQPGCLLKTRGFPSLPHDRFGFIWNRFSFLMLAHISEKVFICRQE